MRKAAIVSWTSIGLLVLTWRTHFQSVASYLDRSPRLQRLMDSLVLSNIAHRPARARRQHSRNGRWRAAHHLHRRTVARSFARTRTARIKHRRGDLIRASGTIGLGISFVYPRMRLVGGDSGVPRRRRLDRLSTSDSGFGQRLIDGIVYDEYANIARVTIRRRRPLQSGDEAIVDPEWKKRRNAKVGDRSSP